MKPWTESRGPIKAIEVDVQKAAVINEMLTEPAGILPVAVDDEIKPFALGLFNSFRSRLLPGGTISQLRRAIAAYVHTKRYYFASAQPGAMRHDFDGLRLEPVSDSDRILAQTRFLDLKQKHAHAGAEAPRASDPHLQNQNRSGRPSSPDEDNLP